MKRWKSDISTIINSFKRGSTLSLMWNLFTYFILALASCETNSFQFEEDYTHWVILVQSNTLSSLKCQRRLTLSQLRHVWHKGKIKRHYIEIHTPIIFFGEHLQKPQLNYLPVQNATRLFYMYLMFLFLTKLVIIATNLIWGNQS